MGVVHMITARRFEQTDADEVAKLVANTMRTTNAKDYSQDYIENELKHLTARDLIARARHFHCYVLLDGQSHQIVAVGSIGPYWGSEVESSLHPDTRVKGSVAS